jgi:hypothetical protein
MRDMSAVLIVPFSVLFPTFALSVYAQARAEGPSSSISSQVRAPQLIDKLPSCSILRTELEDQTHGSGIDQAYMEEMRHQGVWRASIVVRARVRNWKPGELRIERRLFFSKLDGPDSQITDEGNLKTIEESGLPLLLDDVARTRAMNAPISPGIDIHWGRPPKEATALVEVFADSSLSQKRTLFFPAGHPAPLTVSVLLGDSVAVRRLLESGGLSRNQLNDALFSASLSTYDNTNIIRMLLSAGADVNARTPDASTPLMNAIAHPCNLIPLLNAGADANARDKWGRTALQIAREQKSTIAVQLLASDGKTD